MERLLKTWALALIVLLMAAIPAVADGATGGWRGMPVVPTVKGAVKKTLLRDVRRSREHSMQAAVFAKVGDSNTEMAGVLYGLACRPARLDGRGYLKSVIRRYNRVKLPDDRALPGCSPTTSFSRRSNAAQSFTYSWWSTESISELPDEGSLWSRPPGCELTETPLSCEVRLIRPRYALIMSGTNDWGFDTYDDVEPGSETAARISRVVHAVRALGVVPVLSTLPPLITEDVGPGAIDSTNAAIARAARRLRVPMINLWRDLARPGMENQGMEPKGLHLGVFPGDSATVVEPGPTTFRDSVDFRPPALRFGANLRNLIILKTLARLDRRVHAR